MNDKEIQRLPDDPGTDRMMRQAVDGYRVEPGPGLWKRINRKLLWSEILRLNFQNVSWKIWMGSGAGLLLVATALYFGTGGGTGRPVGSRLPHAPAPTASASVPAAITTVSSPSTTPSGSSSPSSTNPSMTPAKGVVEVSPSPHAPGTSTPSNGNNYPGTTGKSAADAGHPRESDLTAKQDTRPESPDPAGESIFHGITLPDRMDDLSRLTPVEARVLSLPGTTDTTFTFSRTGQRFSVLRPVPEKVQFFSAGLGINPEIARYSGPSDYTKVNFWLDGRLTWNFSRFSVGSGVGVGYVFDEGLYRVDYISRDSVGYFENVISYSVNAGNEIIYNTIKTAIYDSLVHAADPRASNRYTYLQVPLLFGYRFYESNLISLTFRAGPAVTLLLDTRKASPELDFAHARILLVSDETPSRIRTAWQVWAGLTFEMRLTRRTSLFLEPTIKVHLKEITHGENASYKAPWAAGLGLGLQYNFGTIKKQP